MSGYLVRLIHNRDIVGFFAAEDFDDFVISVDEWTDVAACEYVELPAGGIMWTSPAAPVPFDISDCSDENSNIERLPWAAAELSETWWNVVYGFTDDQWTRFDPDAPQDPPQSPKKLLEPARVIAIRKRPE